MNTENISQEGATDIKVEKESDDEVETEINLYADHEIKEEMVIGPVVLQEVVNATDCCEDVSVAKKIKLEVKDEKTDQVEPKKEIIEDNTEETISNINIKNQTTLKNEEQSKNLRKCNQTPGITCNDCGQKFRKICELAQHIVSHEKIKQDNNYKCKECTYQTGSQVSLEQHSKLHDIDRIFASDRSKLSHVNKRPKENEYFCSECEYVSPTKSYLEQHLRTHTGEKPYPCSECKYKGATKNALTRHLRSHTGEKTYSCSKCKYECFDKSVISRHVRTHTDKKTFSCSECKYKCANKHYLKKHFRVHSGQNPYLCSVCLYGCGDKNTLAIHLRKHTNEKPYSCSECEYKCANKSYLKVHLRTHTGEKPYSCSKCHYKCSDKSALYRHLCHVAKKGKKKTENTSTEDATDKKVEKESYDEVETAINLYADHETKDEMVIGPVVLQEVVNATDCCEG